MARVICPACKKPGNVPDQYLGNRIKCPSCGERFTAPTLPPSKGEIQRTAATPLAEKPAAVEVAIVNEPPAAAIVAHVQAAPPATAQGTQKKLCLYCGEEIQSVALKCKHCGEILDPALRAAEEAKVIARQQSAPNINVNTAVSNVIGGVAAPRRGFSRLIPVGILLFVAGFVVSMSSATPGADAALAGVGMLTMVVGAVVTM